jgi:DNA-binding MarR family transcriptional regulator/N-acetylglutamate synthase-like GNAT family acetyltransferase
MDNTTNELKLKEQLKTVSDFNCFYGKKINEFNEALLQKTSFTLTETQVISELASHEKNTATEISHELKLDSGYLSRILKGFEKQGLIRREISNDDARNTFLFLTEAGQKESEELKAISQNQIIELLKNLNKTDANRLVGAMNTIENVLSPPKEDNMLYLLRFHQPGDMGWVVQKHGQIYSEDYNLNEQFEALVAGLVAGFIKNNDPKKEKCWIAEKDGETVGSLFLVKEHDEIAKLRLLLVEPKARGLGIGKRLVEESTKFAKKAGYKKVILWTNDFLQIARGIFVKAGYTIVKAESHQAFGRNLISEKWELELN